MREKLVLPEYGREIQQMVDYCVELEDRRSASAVPSLSSRLWIACFRKTEVWRTMSRNSGIISPS